MPLLHWEPKPEPEPGAIQKGTGPAALSCSLKYTNILQVGSVHPARHPSHLLPRPLLQRSCPQGPATTGE